MRVTALGAGLLLSASIFAVGTKPASAQTPTVAAFETTASFMDELKQQDKEVAEAAQAMENREQSEDPQPEQEPKKHTVKEGESLTKIAEQYETEWPRIFAKNLEIEHPDKINPGQEITIPEKDEALELRELPAPEPAYRHSNASSSPTDSAVAQRPAQQQTAARPTRMTGTSSSAGNHYARGYCTWYVKNRRPDLPNNLGDANTWLSRAQAQGFATGSTPRVGAVAYALTGYMHVAYVESVNGNGTVTVSEMNFRGWGVISTRTVSTSSFAYIY